MTRRLPALESVPMSFGRSNGKKALITGITGQDGSYLAELLLEKGYEASWSVSVLWAGRRTSSRVDAAVVGAAGMGRS